ncbi:MAG: hypothetical protein ABR949_05740 [Candidatus Aquilonibacter sp.]|jgi:hypothetical protein
MYTVDEAKIRKIMDIPLGGAPQLKETTAQQYMFYLRQYIASVGPLEKATHAKIVVYIEGVESAWSQRRAASAFRRFFVRATPELKLKCDPSMDLADCGFSRPKNTALVKLQERLIELGMSKARIAALTWHDVKLLVLSSQRSVLSRYVGKNERRQFRELLLRRFPTASQLAGTSKNAELCFSLWARSANLRKRAN